MSIKTGAPFEKVALDILDPLSATNRGNKFIVVISDYCSKWTEAYPLRNHKAKSLWKSSCVGLGHDTRSSVTREEISNLICLER